MNENTTATIDENLIETVQDNEIDNEQNDNKTEAENRNRIGGDGVDEIENELTELKIESRLQREFEQSLEQFWNNDKVVAFIDSETNTRCTSATSSMFNSEIPTARFTSETELETSNANKRKKSKFRIPKSRSTLNFNHVKSRYMDVFKKI